MVLPRARRGLAVLALAAIGLAGAACSDDASPPAADDAADVTSTTAPPTSSEAAPEDEGVPAEPSDGCGTPADVEPVGDEVPGDVEQTFDAAGVERIYRIGVPADYDPDVATPLVLNLHGSGSDAVQASVYADLPRAAAERGMITVAPQSVAGQWELPAEGADADFLSALVDDVEARYCIDRNRVHAVGMSLGAWKAAVTACAQHPRFASVSLVTVEVHPGDCPPLAAVAFHGTADATVPYGEADGGTVDPDATPNAGLPPTLTNIAGWAEGGGCDPEPEIARIGDDVEHRVYAGCDEGVGVELYTIEGGGHTWPGAEIVLGPPELTTSTIDATEITLDWFEDHPRTS